MVNSIEQRIYDLIRPYAGTYLFNIKKVVLTPKTDLDTDLDIDEVEAEDLMNDFLNSSMLSGAILRLKHTILLNHSH